MPGVAPVRRERLVAVDLGDQPPRGTRDRPRRRQHRNPAVVEELAEHAAAVARGYRGDRGLPERQVEAHRGMAAVSGRGEVQDGVAIPAREQRLSARGLGGLSHQQGEEPARRVGDDHDAARIGFRPAGTNEEADQRAAGYAGDELGGWRADCERAAGKGRCFGRQRRRTGAGREDAAGSIEQVGRAPVVDPPVGRELPLRLRRRSRPEVKRRCHRGVEGENLAVPQPLVHPALDRRLAVVGRRRQARLPARDRGRAHRGKVEGEERHPHRDDAGRDDEQRSHAAGTLVRSPLSPTHQVIAFRHGHVDRPGALHGRPTRSTDHRPCRARRTDAEAARLWLRACTLNFGTRPTPKELTNAPAIRTTVSSTTVASFDSCMNARAK